MQKFAAFSFESCAQVFAILPIALRNVCAELFPHCKVPMESKMPDL